MGKRIFSRIVLVSIFFMALFFQGHAKDPDLIRITVRNEMELIRALGSNRVITVAEGSYIDLSKVLEFSVQRKIAGVADLGMISETEAFTGVMAIGSEFSGMEMNIIHLNNLEIVGAGEERPKIVIEPHYSNVLTFTNCNGITLRHLEIGHTEEGYCTGGVLNFNNCKNIKIDDCDLYGCGTEGITASTTETLECTRTIIRDCSYSILSLYGGSNFKFIDCDFHDNRQFSLINTSQYPSNVQFSKCRIRNNNGDLFGLDNPIVMNKCSITHAGSLGTVDMVIDNDCVWCHTDLDPEEENKDKMPPVPLFYYQWEGKISNQEVRLACTRLGMAVIGELMIKDELYTEFLNVLGIVRTDDEILFNIYDSENRCVIRKTFTGHIVGNTLECLDETTKTGFILNTYKGDSRFLMYREADAYCSPFFKSRIISFFSRYRYIDGVYSSVNKAGSSENYRSISISRLGEHLDVVEFTIDCKNGKHKFSTSGKTEILGASFKFQLSDGECDYEFEVIFYNGFLFIIPVSGKPDGCFDSNIGIEGIYVQETSIER